MEVNIRVALVKSSGGSDGVTRSGRNEGRTRHRRRRNDQGLRWSGDCQTRSVCRGLVNDFIHSCSDGRRRAEGLESGVSESRS